MSPQFGLIVRFDLKPKAGADFDKLVVTTIKQIRENKPHTLVYTPHKIADQPNARIFYELYKDLRAFESHKNQPYIKHFLVEREQYLARAPRIEVLK